MGNVDNTLKERGETHGDYKYTSECAQDLKDVITGHCNWQSMEADQRESLDMICSKIARLACGDANHRDTWLDVAGYAQLIVNRLENKS